MRLIRFRLIIREQHRELAVCVCLFLRSEDRRFRQFVSLSVFGALFWFVVFVDRSPVKILRRKNCSPKSIQSVLDTGRYRPQTSAYYAVRRTVSVFQIFQSY